MNFLAHGRRFLEEPYFVVGTAMPDLLNVVDRRMRVSAKSARLWVADDDPRVAAVARGVIQHLSDGKWLRKTAAFAGLTLQFTVAVRDALPAVESFRASFVGHILVELLLDNVLATDTPGLLDAYFEAVEAVSPEVVQDSINRMATRQSTLIVELIPRFCTTRFLCDYADDEKLLRRINNVLVRVKLEPLPPPILQMLPHARQQVRLRRDELLGGETERTNNE